MNTLLTRDEFVRARDEISLQGLYDRKPKLEADLVPALKEIRRLRRWRETVKTYEIASGYNLTKEQFRYRMRVVNMLEKIEGKLNDAYAKWAVIDVELSNVVRTIPVVEARLAAYETPVDNVVSVADRFMGMFGLKRASGE